MNYLAEHKHISEREPDGSWEDCTWDSGLEWYRLCFDKSKPATHAEAQALRAASGRPPTGGSNIPDLRRGIAKRYNKSVPAAISGWSALWSALKPGMAAVVQGSMKAFGPNHHLSRYDRNFDGGHAVLVVRMNESDSVWWCDPEGPKTGYNGEWVTKAELQKFVTMFPGDHLVAPVIVPVTQQPEADMPRLTTYAPGTSIMIKPGSNVRKAPDNNSAPIRTLTAPEKWVVIGTVKGEALAGASSYYVRWIGGTYEYMNENGVTSVTPPKTQADIDAAVAKAVAPLNARIVAAKTALG